MLHQKMDKNIKSPCPLVSIVPCNFMGTWRQAFHILTSTQGRHHPWLMQSLEKGTLLASEDEAL